MLVVLRVGQLFAATFFIFVCVLIGPLRAATLTGDTISAQYYYPTTSTPYVGGPPNVSSDPSLPAPLNPVGSGEEGTLLVEKVTTLHIDFDVSKLVISFNTTLTDPVWNSVDPVTHLPVLQNGPKFTIQSGPVAGNSFIGIANVSTSNNFPVTAFLEDAGTLFVNWAGMPYHTGDTVTVFFANADDAPPASTPLPAALPLFVGGLGALGLLGWRRNRRELKR